MPPDSPGNGTSTAADFLTRCFAPDETIALLVRRESPNKTLQRIAPLEHALAPRYLGWLAHENSTGANIYVAANPLRPASRKRTKECIAVVRHLYLDLDTDGDARLTSLRASEAVPPPNAVLSTSLGKYQILWRVDGFTLEQQESALKLLAITFGGDPACTDCNRVLRLPGFLNCKYDPAYRVTVEYPGASTWNSDEFRLDILAADAVLSSRSITPRKHPANHSNSEHEWAWVLHQLTRGTDAAKLTRKSDPVDDIHYLIVLARMTAPRTPAITQMVGDALLGLDRKFIDRKLNRDTNWPLRIAELHAHFSKSAA